MERRDFIKGLGAAGITMAAAPHLAACVPNSTECALKGTSKSTGRLELTWRRFEARMKHTFTISGSSRKSTPIVLTELTWNGITGYGEAAMPPYLGETYESCEAFLAKAAAEVLPRYNDPFLIEDILAEVDAVAPGNPSAKAAIDIALHDLTGKLIGQPWWKIWGLDPSKTPYTSYTIGFDESDEKVIEKTREASWSHILKVKLGQSEEADKRMISLIRSVTDTPIVVDANQGWKSKEEALEMIHWLSERRVEMIEQPMKKTWIDEHAWLTERSPLPIIADESCQRLSDIRRLQGAFTGINIKLMKCTGLNEARKMTAAAQALGMKVMVGCMTETSVAISAMAQLSPLASWADLDGNVLIANDCFTGMKLLDGKITLENLPAIGVKPL